jgi:16S rRNA (uracil1498-N3)-methyltransferase
VSEKWFYAETIPPVGETVALDPQEARHATRARHLQAGAEATVCDGAGTTARIVLADVNRRSATGIVQERTAHPPPAHRVHLASALPKGDRLATLLSMATQLGMTDFTPLLARRSVVLPSPETPERWSRILREACKQSRRAWQPTIHPPATPLESLKNASVQSVSLLMDAAGKPARVLLNHPPGDRLLLVGPEGGFDAEESATLVAAGAQPMALTTATLRIETAAAAALAILELSPPGQAED